MKGEYGRIRKETTVIVDSTMSVRTDRVNPRHSRALECK